MSEGHRRVSFYFKSYKSTVSNFISFLLFANVIYDVLYVTRAAKGHFPETFHRNFIWGILEIFQV